MAKKSKRRRQLLVRGINVIKVKNVIFGENFPKKWQKNLFISISMKMCSETDPESMRVFVVIENKNPDIGGCFNIEMDHQIPFGFLPSFNMSSSLLFQGGVNTISSGLEIACSEALTRDVNLEIAFEYIEQDQTIVVMLTSPKHFSSQTEIPFNEFSEAMREKLKR